MFIGEVMFCDLAEAVHRREVELTLLGELEYGLTLRRGEEFTL